MYKNDMIKRTHVPGVPFPSASASNMDVLRYASELLAPRRPGEPAVRQRTAEDRAKDPAGADNTRATLAQMLCITRMQAEGDTVAGAGLDDQWDQLRALWKIVDPKGEGSLDVEDLSEADRNIILHTASDVANEDAPAESPH
ncbi:hypothetical protein MSAN_00195000 [Mycena sanguinolenta]|uniref:EF-hand domain-containing protein n=1 Tax=Mycena sanguinolenta TaxID=230812 RepID=A0A8H6ZLK7_9AGAR|nr:hypothetical protein MSAN_00195000 [Mycena sanguinolenta]